MEQLSNLTKNMRDRFSNPLFFSFIISWTFINWRIPIGLIMYNNAALKTDGYTSYMNLIEQNYTIQRSIILPLLTALFYTFGFPFVRNWILAFQTWIIKRSTDWNLKIAASGQVSMEKYIQLRERYFTQIKTVENLFLEEGKYLFENKELNIEKLKLTTQNNNLNNNLQHWQSMNNVRLLDGEWNYHFKSKDKKINNNYRMTISGSQAWLYSDASRVDMLENYQIDEFFCNPETKRLCFVLKSATQPEKRLFHNLNFPNSITELRGTENYYDTILYTKLKE